jgi:hypothetical protein
MTTTSKPLAANFAPETQFTLEPEARLAGYEERLETLRITLVRRLVRPGLTGAARRRVRRAIAEAELLAFATPYPLLVLPLLAEEKARTVRRTAATDADRTPSRTPRF